MNNIETTATLKNGSDQADLTKTYALKAKMYEGEEYSIHFCQPGKDFPKNWLKSGVTEGDVFSGLLEEFLANRMDGKSSLPRKGMWLFLVADSEEEILAGGGVEVASLHSDDRDSLWQLYQFTGRCCMFRIETDY